MAKKEITVSALLAGGSYDADSRALIERAYHFAEEAHEGQKRFSGEPYFVHAFATGKTLAELGMDAETIAAGLLHDTLEDGVGKETAIEREFGANILFLVQGVTKLGKLKYQGVERHTESLRKLFLAMSKDIRVLIIKLADRMHNVETLEYVRPEKQRRIALETLEIYAPIANRLGVGKMRGALEDASFPYAYPEAYAETREILKQRGAIKRVQLEKAYRTLQKTLAAHGIVGFTGDFRTKHLYSLYRKLKRYDMNIEKIYDLAALRIIVPTVDDCYRVLGIVHNIWRPLPGRVKDYIAFPKPNGYQSLHTTVLTGDGAVIEIQIRTGTIHREAEYGIASHFAYKEGIVEKSGHAFNRKLAWVKQLSEWQKNINESGEFLENLRVDFFSDRVFVFTPEGDVVDLPEAATPVDFAYAIHSDIGAHASGAKVNGKFSSLDTALQNGDIVEIVTKKGSSPSQKWLGFAKTTLARKHIKNALSKKERGE
ncbi:MAG: hypothetical protein COW88_01585 [Candidatus Lloydbacteria bacterium CG22_combo_CG10-13_8_21_14_all_47_15]|uniref:TGS domain-containing protein n=1 Tax=Candidatus Lloydbacteria bacterium CG22_combo_CG10-13_8_21_14_all_47_15 TaxID=1974635 RepID=A0A2H0CUG5_9BACT|nr:MAG: hypothetical protein COW88_01585 [Candidatus Lloydbacteria bacterium CG22_combo_CG10-13_8_21_14_all_47_15]